MRLGEMLKEIKKRKMVWSLTAVFGFFLHVYITTAAITTIAMITDQDYYPGVIGASVLEELDAAIVRSPNALVGACNDGCNSVKVT